MILDATSYWEVISYCLLFSVYRKEKTEESQTVTNSCV